MSDSAYPLRPALASAAAVAVTVAAAVAWSPRGAGAHVSAKADSGSPVTFRNSDCTTPSDPINVVVLGPTATPEETAIHIRHHSPATGSGRGSAQYVSTHGHCIQTQAGAKGGAGSEGVYHSRVWQNAGDEYHEPRATFAPMHHERTVDCGKPYKVDAVYKDDPEYPGRSGFDGGAAKFYESWDRNGGHRFERVDEVPHKRTFQQCNGDKVGWNGRILYFRISS